MSFVYKMIAAAGVVVALAAPVVAQEETDIDVMGLTCGRFAEMTSEDQVLAIPVLRTTPTNGMESTDAQVITDPTAPSGSASVTVPKSSDPVRAGTEILPSDMTDEELMAFAMTNCEGNPELPMVEAIVPKV